MSVKFIDLRSNFKTKFNLIVNGQGVFQFKSTSPYLNLLQFRIYSSDKTTGIQIEFTEKSVFVTNMMTLKPYIDSTNNQGLSMLDGVSYWFSIDSQNQVLYGGLGEARKETVIYTYKFPTNKDQHMANKLFLEGLTTIEISESSVLPIRLLRDPITATVPLIIRDTDTLTMSDIAEAKYLPKANLSHVAQQLYDCISGKKFMLNDPSFPDFSKAIEYSIKTPGCWCNTTLISKANEFSKTDPNILETYLRITLGQNNGESPGIPYVMEIWPVGHYSPIHSHSEANAIIRVLHGSINVKLFPFLCPQEKPIDPFATTDFKKDDITWISPTLNQVHQLTNLASNKDTCITIQCYKYDTKDKKHYDYFDYIDSDGKKQQYEPDSDMDFIAFKKLMKEEWSNRNCWNSAMYLV